MCKKNIIIGLITGFVTILILVVIFTIRYGVSWWIDPTNDLLVFFPFWFILFCYVGYGTAKYYYNQKQLFYIDYKDESESYIAEKWRYHKKFILSKLFLIIAKFFAVITPFYILAYLDNSEIVTSNLVYIISFSIIGIVSYIVSKMLLVNYKAHQTS